MELIAVVMGCETSAKRLTACKAMLDHGFANYAVVTPRTEDVYQIPVKLGTQQTVTAIAGQQTPLLIDKAQKSLVTTEVTLDSQVTAPVSQGQRLGTMTVKAGQQILMEIPMVAESAVSRLTFGQIFLHMLKQTLGAK